MFKTFTVLFELVIHLLNITIFDGIDIAAFVLFKVLDKTDFFVPFL